jgi:CRP/FNR family transcriptional regulator
MERQETYLNTDAWSSSFVQSNLELWEKILDARNILCLPPRTTVFSQGDPARHVYVVQRGRIILSVSSPAGDEKVLMYAGVGCIIGEQALISGMEYSCHAVTLEESCFYRIPASLFRRYLSSNTDVAMAFIFNLLNKDQSLTAHIADLSFKSAKYRLIQELLFCAKTYGKQRNDGVLIQRIFSQEDLGKRIQASRVTVNKFIQELERQKLLHHEGRRLVLDNVQKLRDMLENGEK